MTRPKIQRILAPAPGRALATIHNGLIYAVAYDPDAAEGILAQTRNALAFLDDLLGQAGGDKGTLLQVTIYLTDITQKADMDTVWTPWIGPEANWPQRACVEADMGQGSLIEIVAIAAVG